MNPLLPPALWALEAVGGPAWRAFQRSLQQPEAAQSRVLKRLLVRSACSDFGRCMGLDAGNPRVAFERLQPMDYAELAAQIKADMAAGTHSFSPDPVRFYERTSGSSGAVKHIPYNRALRNAFDRMFRIWACDLLKSVLKLSSGRVFMSVSPPLLGRVKTEHGVPVGTADDTAYLRRPLALLLRPFLVAPAAALRLREATGFKDVLSAALLAEPKLEVVSVWNPSFWLVLLDHIERALDRLAPELRAGAMRREGLDFRFGPIDAARLSVIARAPRDSWTAVWSRLQLISCWTEAEAARPAAALRARLAGVPIQGKGLLATEAPISVPLADAPAPVPLLDEVYLELAMADGSVRALRQWREGDEGEIVVTQPGGLLRYRLRDRVAVSAFHHACPCLSFLGRAGAVVDLVGEKLSEAFVHGLLEPLQPAARLMTLCPVANSDPPFYALLCDVDAEGLARTVDDALQESPHYRIARAMGQLGPLRLLTRPGLAAEWHAALQEAGFQVGNIKERSLLTQPGLAARLWERLSQGAA